MAITYVRQPSGLVGANSPLLYQVDDTALKSTAGFYYKFQIYVWNGSSTIPATPVATLTKLPDVYANGRAYIDAHRIVTQYLNTNYLTFGGATALINTGSVHVQLKVSGFNTAGGTTPVSSAVNSNLVLATRGYSLTSEGINKDITKVVLTDRTKLYLTTDTTIDYLWYMASSVTSITIGTHTITPTAVGTDSNKKIQGFDVKQAMVTGGTWGTNSNITFNLSGGGTSVLPVEFDCPTRYGSYTLLYMNRYGVYDGMTMNGVYESNWNVSRENYQSALLSGSDLTASWSTGMRQTRQFNINSGSTILLNTNWIDESYVDIVGQIAMSEAVVFNYQNVYYGCHVTDTDIQRKRATNVKLISYTIGLSTSQPYINKIVR